MCFLKKKTNTQKQCLSQKDAQIKLGFSKRNKKTKPNTSLH